MPQCHKHISVRQARVLVMSCMCVCGRCMCLWMRGGQLANKQCVFSQVSSVIIRSKCLICFLNASLSVKERLITLINCSVSVIYGENGFIE